MSLRNLNLAIEAADFDIANSSGISQYSLSWSLRIPSSDKTIGTLLLPLSTILVQKHVTVLCLTEPNGKLKVRIMSYLGLYFNLTGIRYRHRGKLA